MKKGKMAFVAWLIALVVFNVVVFAIPTPWKYSATYWCGYAFTVAAFILAAFTVIFGFGNANTANRKFLGIPLVRIGYSYLIAQTILGLVFVFISMIPSWIAIVISVVLLGFYMFSFLSAMIARDAVLESETKIKVQTQFIRSMTSDIAMLKTKASCEEMRKLINGVYEAVRYSDPVTDPTLEPLEISCSEMAVGLSDAVSENDIPKAEKLSTSILTVIRERNEKCKLLK